MHGRLYATCPSCSALIYRDPGRRHGDGRVDSDESPVWLLDALLSHFDYDERKSRLLAHGCQIGLVDCGGCIDPIPFEVNAKLP